MSRQMVGHIKDTKRSQERLTRQSQHPSHTHALVLILSSFGAIGHQRIYHHSKETHIEACSQAALYASPFPLSLPPYISSFIMNAATLRTATVSSSLRRRLGGGGCSGPQQCRTCRTTLETCIMMPQQHRRNSTFRGSISLARIGRKRGAWGINATGLPPLLGTSGPQLPQRPGSRHHPAILAATSVMQQRPYTRTATTTTQQLDAAETHLASLNRCRGWWRGGCHGSDHAWSSSSSSYYEMWGWTTAAAAASAAVTYASLEAFTPLQTTSLEAAAAAEQSPDPAAGSENQESMTTMQSRPSVQATTSLFAPSFYDTTSPGATTATSTVSVSSQSPPRNVMLHRMRSLKGRSLTAKYLVDWKTVLGEGAYGSVHPARLLATGEKVALKKISRHYTNASGFKTETDALLRIYDNGGHPNISGLRDMYEDHNCYYLILDLVTGGEMFEVRIETHEWGANCCGTAIHRCVNSHVLLLLFLFCAIIGCLALVHCGRFSFFASLCST
jgi:Protein kinase domain